MANLATQTITRTTDGITPTYSAAAGGGDTFTPDDRTFLHIKNGSGGSITATVVTPGTVADVGITDLAAAIGAGSEIMVGPFPAQHFADPADGLADITYSGVTSLTIAVIRVPA